MATVRIDGEAINDWESFHLAFKEALGFPGFYGMNMDAWIDCMSCLDDEEAGLSRLTLGDGERLFIEVTDAEGFNSRLPEIFDALVDCSAFANNRYVNRGKLPALAL